MKTILHLKLLLRQDADMLAVAEIVKAFDGARLDDDNYVVYYNDEPKKVEQLVGELHPFTYGLKMQSEIF